MGPSIVLMRRALAFVVAALLLALLPAAVASADDAAVNRSGDEATTCGEYRSLGAQLHSREFDDRWAMCQLYPTFDPEQDVARAEDDARVGTNWTVALSADYRDGKARMHVLVVDVSHEMEGGCWHCFGAADVHAFRFQRGVWTRAWSAWEAIEGQSGGYGPESVGLVKLGARHAGLEVERRVGTWNDETHEVSGSHTIRFYALRAKGVLRVGPDLDAAGAAASTRRRRGAPSSASTTKPR